MQPRILEEALAARLLLAPLDVDQLHRMIQAGIVPEGLPIELLDGTLVFKDRGCAGGPSMTVGPAHALAVGRIQRLGQLIEARGHHVRTQVPITLAPLHEPEPDGAIVLGAPESYASRHPGPAEVRVVIEVADSSLIADRTTKQRIYADAGIPTYLLVNLQEAQLELHEMPLVGQGRYARVSILKAGDRMSLHLGAAELVEVAARDLLG